MQSVCFAEQNPCQKIIFVFPSFRVFVILFALCAMLYAVHCGEVLIDIETDTLCQWKVLRPVDRACLPPHLGLPCIRTRLPSSPGLLLPTKSATYLRPRRPNVHIGNATVASHMTQKGLRFLEIIGEYG